MSEKLKKRDEIPSQYKWSIEAMYPDESQWDVDYKSVETEAEAFSKWEGNLCKDGPSLGKAFEERDAIYRKLEKLYVYGHMKKDEDNQVTQYQAMNEKAQVLISRVSAAMSFFIPEILETEESLLLSFLENTASLQVYDFAIRDLIRQKKHVLSKTEENMMAKFSEVTPGPKQTFSMLNNADMTFGQIENEGGKSIQLTHGNYINFLESKDRKVREAAFKAMYKQYTDHKNTLATTYNYNVKTKVVFSKLRKHPSALEASLSNDNVPKTVYTNLIDAINENLPVLHRYVDLRKKMLGLEDIRMYDMYVPLVQLEEKKIPYEKALEMVEAGLAPLGKEYLSILKKGFYEENWIDVYENQGKTSGAYSFGSYDSRPYVLLNYSDSMKDVMTIAHEMGHSVNSYYTRKTQPYVYGGHSIFTAEVASTVNESLMMDYFIKNAKTKEEKIYLINMYIEEFRTTVFRQTMFAEFEWLAHEGVESGEILTNEWLSKMYGDLNKKYFGPKVSYDAEINSEWSRIPHFYNAFYVYKYATGFSAATALSKGILSKEDKALERYLEFLKAGENDYPIPLLQNAGVNMLEKKPVADAMETFKSLIDQLEDMI